MKYLLVLIGLSFSFVAKPQKILSLKEAQDYLQKNNLLLLAEEYNISAQKAALIQARIWENPYISGEVNAINPQNNSYFDTGKNGQKALAIQQLIYLGGKKRNEIRFAKSNIELAELQYEELLRNLNQQLSENFYDLYFNNLNLESINYQINILDTLVKNHEIQVNKGNIPLKDLVRLQSLLINLTTEKNNLLKQIADCQFNLAVITGTNEILIPAAIQPHIFQNLVQSNVDLNKASTLTDENNLIIKTYRKLSENKELYVNWQKSLARPDLTAGISYDQRGGAFQNQVNFTLGMPLPLWNRNAGNIKIAQTEYKQSNTQLELKKLEVHALLNNAISYFNKQKDLFYGLELDNNKKLEQVYSGVVTNFQKRNISMIEFTDFMESYHVSIIQTNELKKSLILSGIAINHISNSEIINIK